MPGIQRMFDPNTGGGIITAIPQTTVFANSKLVAVQGSIGSAHAPCPKPPIHCAGAWATIATQSSVFVHSIPVIRDGDIDTCGHARTAGSTSVFAV